MIRRVAGLAVLLAFSLWAAAPVQAQTAADYAQGVTVSGTTATIFFNPTSTTTTWTDVHYAVNGGALQNLRMARNATSMPGALREWVCSSRASSASMGSGGGRSAGGSSRS